MLSHCTTQDDDDDDDDNNDDSGNDFTGFYVLLLAAAVATQMYTPHFDRYVIRICRMKIRIHHSS